MPSGFDWGDKDTCAFRFAFFGRMLFSCLVDADFRDTEKFYCKVEGRVADRDWPELSRIVDDLIARFDYYDRQEGYRG
jgi:CRISPR-associated endonuclease/helicase Cas3